MKKLTFFLVTVVAASFSAALYADDYPSRPITLVAVFGPGSASDTICASSPISSAPYSANRSSSKIAQGRMEHWLHFTSIISPRMAIRS
jgi:hypothetical protein